MALYLWVVWTHILGVFGFLLAHGASAIAMLSLRRERQLERVRALIDLSRTSILFAYPFLALVLLTGIAAGFLGGWWGQLWIWSTIFVGVVMSALMYPYGTRRFNLVRKAVGLPYYEKRKKQPALLPVPPEELERLLSSTSSFGLTAIGVIGLLLILWLMVFKPF